MNDASDCMTDSSHTEPVPAASRSLPQAHPGTGLSPRVKTCYYAVLREGKACRPRKRVIKPTRGRRE